MTERAITFQVLVMPDGRYELVSGSGPLGWIEECLSYGGVVHTIEATVPIPPGKPRLMGRLKNLLGNPPDTVGCVVRGGPVEPPP